MWDSLPDDALRQAAAAGKLSTDEQIRAQARRMLADPRAKTKPRLFFLQWMKVETPPELSKDPKTFKAFDAAIATDLRTSLKMFVENVMWEHSQTMFVTINLPGGSNNDNDIWYGTPTMSAAQEQEIIDRTAADLRWLDAAFARAKADGVGAVVIMAQADMWDPEKGAAHQSGAHPAREHDAARARILLGNRRLFRSARRTD